MQTPAPFDRAALAKHLNAYNRFWDLIFYDVESLTQPELNTLFSDKRGGILSPYAYGEGEIIVVPPKEAGEIRHYKHTFQFLNEKKQDIRAIVVAGVGSSIYGTAALARNVADTYNFEVAGIVTGYGGMDLLTEAWGGWSVLGALERGNLRSDLVVSHTADVKTLLEILMAEVLMDDPPQLEYLVGHSKGSLLIDFVLHRFEEELQDVPDSEYEPLLERLNIVTLGAVVSPPELFRPNVRQFMGELDGFGRLNSHRGIPFEEVPGAWHHLNPDPVKAAREAWRRLNPLLPLPQLPMLNQLPMLKNVNVRDCLNSKPSVFPKQRV